MGAVYGKRLNKMFRHNSCCDPVPPVSQIHASFSPQRLNRKIRLQETKWSSLDSQENKHSIYRSENVKIPDFLLNNNKAHTKYRKKNLEM